jgi:hypothetical protein
MVRFTLNRINRDYPITSGHELDIWHQNSGRILNYGKLWNYYKGQHWNYVPEAGEPVTTANFVQLFVDKHAQYLFGSPFEIHANFRGNNAQATADALNEEWEKNDVTGLGFQMAQVGGVTGDLWLNFGLDDDSIFGSRIKMTVFPSEYVFPIFQRRSDLNPSAVLVQWPDSEVVSNAFGKVRVRTFVSGQYWTKDQVWELRDGVPVNDPRPNLLGDFPWVHIPNLRVGTEFWGMSDIGQIIDINREYNEKITDIGDIINYHGSPVTVVIGAKASNLQKGAKKIWSLTNPQARVENLELSGDLGAANAHLQNLKDTLFQLGNMPIAAFGGAEAISNTSGVAIALQFAPILEHMKKRRIAYGRGIQQANFLILRIKEILGVFKANGRPMPYYSAVKWSDPMPRDRQMRLNELQIMHSLQLLSRLRILRELIHDDIAPAELETQDAEKVLQEALDEEVEYTELLGQAAMIGQTPPGGMPGQGQQPPASGPQGPPGPMTQTASAEQSSMAQQQKAGAAAAVA